MDQLLDLKGKGVVIFGGGQGIGGSAVQQFVSTGARVLCVDRDPDAAKATAERSGGFWAQADALDRESLAAVFHKAGEELGGVHAVIDIIGMARVKPLLALDEADWAFQYDIVLKHAFLVLQEGMKVMERGSSFTFVGSISGERVVWDQAGYGSSKAALHHLVRCAAREFGGSGVRVNCVAPGYIRTPRLEQILSPKQWENVNAETPLGRPADPDEIASCMVFLSSKMASIVTGQVLHADGGVSVCAPYSRLQPET